MVEREARLITREPKYAEIIQRWDALWSLEELERPLWLIPTLPALTAIMLAAPQPLQAPSSAAEARPATTGESQMRRLLLDKEAQLRGSLAVLQWREAFEIGDDFVPHLQPQQGTTVFASAFGSEVEYFDHTLPWAHPVIKPEDPPEKVYDLPAPAVTDGQLGTMLEFTDYYVQETNGRYPIALTDLQGPLDTAYLVWESSAFMVAMYTNPKEVHHLMRLVTDLIIGFVKEMRSRCPEFIPCHYPPLYLPDGRGLAISDDCLAVVSPKLYEEFALPYVNELSEEFGGIFIHSCGDFVHQLDNLTKVHGLRGLNFGATETPFEAIWERFGGKTVIVPHLGLNKDIHFESNRDYLGHVLETKTTNRGLCIVVIPRTVGADRDTLTRFVARTREMLGA